MKKIISKAISVFLVLTLCFAVLAPAAYALDGTDTQLKFGINRRFKILQISDIQDGGIIYPITKELIETAVKKTQPDLVVLTGDNIAGYRCGTYIKPLDKILVKNAIKGYMSVFEKAGIPVAVVFGNHDDQTTKVTKEEQMKLYSEYSCFVGIDEGESLFGCGTYNLPIYSHDGKKVNYNLWMFDSNTYDEANGGYDTVHQDQLDWYVQKSNELKAANGGKVVPSMAFQHIIVPEIFDALKEVPQGTAGAVEKNGKFYVLDESNTKAGSMHEGPCPGTINGGQFETIRKQGDVSAMFFGHDHVNTFEVSHKGIDLVATPGVGFCSYGDETRGVRVITINEDDPLNYKTEVLSYYDFYGDDPLADLHFKMFASELGAWTNIGAGLGYILLKLVYTLVS